MGCRCQRLRPGEEAGSSQQSPSYRLRDSIQRKWCLPAAVLPNLQRLPLAQLWQLPAVAAGAGELAAWQLQQLVELPHLLEFQPPVLPLTLRHQLTTAAALPAVAVMQPLYQKTLRAVQQVSDEHRCLLPVLPPAQTL